MECHKKWVRIKKLSYFYFYFNPQTTPLIRFVLQKTNYFYYFEDILRIKSLKPLWELLQFLQASSKVLQKLNKDSSWINHSIRTFHCKCFENITGLFECLQASTSCLANNLIFSELNSIAIPFSDIGFNEFPFGRVLRTSYFIHSHFRCLFNVHNDYFITFYFFSINLDNYLVIYIDKLTIVMCFIICYLFILLK